jgi:SAM-dependent methyltransferase
MNEEQVALWNGPAGTAWVESQQLLDRLFEPFQRMLAEAARAAGARCVLDVGCGTGATTLAAARTLGPQARCVGVDVSEPMITLARSRAARESLAAEFLVADAQTVELPARFDLVMSRFGVMFFEDPVAAFANLRRAAVPGAGLHCLVFRGAEQNPFMTVAERAAAPLLPAMPVRKAGGPGQFAFADAGYVRGILSAAGWAGIELQAVDVECRFPAAELPNYFTRLGPVGLALRQAQEPVRSRVLATLRAAFDAYVRDGAVSFTAACWRLSARLATS